MRWPGGDYSYGYEAKTRPVVEVPILFVPDDWTTSDAVHVRFHWEYTTVTDPALKENPRSVVNVVLPSMGRTGDVISVAELPAHDISLGILALVPGDIPPARDDPLRFLRILSPERVPAAR
jgi:hypothetical protein